MSLPTRLGGRRGIAAAVATACLALIGTVLIVLGVHGGEGPPEPPASAAETPSGFGPPAHRSDQPIRGRTQEVGRQRESRTPDFGRTLDAAKPVELTVPTIDVHTTRLVPLGRQPSGKIEVPRRNFVVGYYKKGPTPGQLGPAVMGGHVDSDAGPAVFYDLGELRPGDTIRVRRADGLTAVFTVYAVEQYPKNDFPTYRVYAPRHGRAELRLITCGGTFNEETQHYRSNIVVYARMTAVRT